MTVAYPYLSERQRLWGICLFSISGGTPTLQRTSNVSSLVDSGVGDFSITWASARATARGSAHLFSVLPNSSIWAWASLKNDVVPDATGARLVTVDDSNHVRSDSFTRAGVYCFSDY